MWYGLFTGHILNSNLVFDSGNSVQRFMQISAPDIKLLLYQSLKVFLAFIGLVSTLVYKSFSLLASQ